MWRIQDYLKSITTVAVIFMVGGLAAQDFSEATSLYNEGGAAIQAGDKELALQKFEECIGICNVLYEEEEDEEAENLMLQIKPQLPTLYLKVSQELAQAKEFKKSLEFAEKAKVSAAEEGNENVEDNARLLKAKIYTSYASSYFKKSDFEGALGHAEKAVDNKADYFKGQYILVVILAAMENDEALINATKELVKVNGKDVNKDKAIDKTFKYFYNKGVLAKNSSNYDEAILNINTSLEFNADDEDANYLLLTTFISKEDWANAIIVGTKALTSSSSSNVDRIYFELGKAYFGSGDIDGACDAYSKVVSDTYKENANYQMEHIVKCN